MLILHHDNVQIIPLKELGAGEVFCHTDDDTAFYMKMEYPDHLVIAKEVYPMPEDRCVIYNFQTNQIDVMYSQVLVKRVEAALVVNE